MTPTARLDEALPCPFCGREPQAMDRASDVTDTKHIWFLYCHCEGYSAHAHQAGNTQAEVIAAWNRRAPAVPPAGGPMTDGFYSCAHHGTPIGPCCPDAIWNPPRPVPAVPAAPMQQVVAATEDHPAIYKDGPRLVAGKHLDAVPEKPQEAVAWADSQVDAALTAFYHADVSEYEDEEGYDRDFDGADRARMRAALAVLYGSPVALWTCPDCGFGFDAAHTNEPNGGYSCPVCELAALHSRSPAAGEPTAVPSLRRRWLADVETLHLFAAHFEGQKAIFTHDLAQGTSTVYDVAACLRGIASTLTQRVTLETDPKSDHFIDVLTEAMGDLRIARDSTKGSLAQQVAHELRIAHPAHPVSPALVGDEERNAEKWGFDAHDATEMRRLAEGAPVRPEHYLVFQRIAAHLTQRVAAPRLAEVEAAMADLEKIVLSSDHPQARNWGNDVRATLLALLGPAGGTANEPSAADATAMRRFTVYRRGDLSATHNDQQAAPADQPQYEGVVFSDGRVALRWLTPLRSTSCWDSLDDALGVHGHPEPRYGTELVWHDAALSVAVPAHGAGETK